PQIYLKPSDITPEPLVVDETNLAIDASANFAANFSAISLFGADGPGSLRTAYTLSLSSNGVDSGLIDVLTGQAVLLFLNGNVVEGHTSISNDLVFTVSIDAGGTITLD